MNKLLIKISIQYYKIINETNYKQQFNNIKT